MTDVDWWKAMGMKPQRSTRRRVVQYLREQGFLYRVGDRFEEVSKLPIEKLREEALAFMVLESLKDGDE